MYDITPVIKIILALLSIIITSFLIPYLKQKTTASERKKIYEMVQTMVKAAEQLFGHGTGKEKLQYVTSALERKGYRVDLDDAEDELRVMIESAVLELKDNE